MQKCKFCQAEMEETSTVCPVCGKDNAEQAAAPMSEAQEATPEEAVTPEEPTQGAEAVTEEPEAASELPTEEPAAAEEPEAPQQAEAPEEPEAAVIGTPGVRATPGKIALAAAAAVVLLAVLVALVVYSITGDRKQEAELPPVTKTQAITDATVSTETVETTPATVPADGNPDDVTCKGSYTASDEDVLANRDTVVATVDGKELTNGVLQVYYWQAVQGFLNSYGSYASYFGLDYTKPLDTQLSMEGGMTWQQYFLMTALDGWHQLQAMGIEAEANNVGISEEDQAYLDGVSESLETTASQYGMTVEELLNRSFGPGATFDDFHSYLTANCLGIPYYYSQCDKLVPSEQELEDYFTANEAQYNSNNITKDGILVDVRHILIAPEGGTTGEDGTTTYSEEEWNACQQKAEEILSQWQSGEKTEESFAALAGTHSVDGGSNQNGGLYENVYVDQMVPEFNDWCFEESRKPGDTGLVKTQFGYHVMYFSGSRPQWRYYAEQGWKNEQTTALLDNMVQAHPLEVSYDKILLGLAPLG